MLNNVIIDDDFFPVEMQEELKNAVLERSSWKFLKRTNVEPNGTATLDSNAETFQFVCDEPGGQTENGEPVQILRTLVQKFFQKHNVNIDEVIRIKSNILTKSTSNEYHSPHIDTDVPHMVFLYYVNDSDGDTYFFDRFYIPDLKVNTQSLVVSQRVSPKQGRGILFNGHQYHASSSPVDSNLRCVINFCFIPE
jgi:hypothetical protein